MKKLAVIGKDVSKSVSPEIHNYIAEKLGLEISYEKISVPEEEFESRIDGLLSEYDGLNLTIPYKLSVISHLKKTEGDALAFGAVNTVLTSTLTGYNTDGSGFMQMLDCQNVKTAGERALVLGAGGAGRSVAKKLLDCGSQVEIYDRNFSTAKNVENEFKGVKAVSEVTAEKRAIIVNATGVGMHKTEGVSPVTGEVLAACRVAVDLIYEPKQSEFLLIADGFHRQTANGAAMLFYQAYAADCIFFDKMPDVETANRLWRKYREVNA